MIKLIDVKKRFFTENGKRSRYVLKGINLELPDTGFVSILGPSGCGKTTFLNLLSLLDNPDEGDIFFDNIKASELSEQEKDEFRHYRMGYIYQEYNLIRHLSVYDNIKLAFNLGSIYQNKEDEEKRIQQLIDELGLEEIIDQLPASLSGGEKERVAIARALANNPDIILADEPTGALDDVNAEEVMKELKRLSETKLVVMVSHNIALVEKYSDRIVRIHKGVVSYDSNSAQGIEPKELQPKEKHKRTSSIFSLALKRIRNKKGRYIFLGSINTLGIIGIAISMSVFSGANAFSKTAENDALRTYPLTVSNIYYGTGNSFMTGIGKLFPTDGNIHRINNNDSTTHVNSITSTYISYLKDELAKRNISDDCLVMRKGLAPMVLLEGKNGQVASFEATDIKAFTGFEAIWREASNYFRPLVGGTKSLNETYDLVYGKLPTNPEDVLVVLGNHDDFPAYMFDLLGYRGETIDYQTMMERRFKFVDNDQYYLKSLNTNSVTGKFMKDNEALKAEGKQADEVQTLLGEALKLYYEGGKLDEMDEVLKQVESYFESEEETRELYFYNSRWNAKELFKDEVPGLKMSVCGIVRPKKSELFPYLTPGFYYSKEYNDEFLKWNEKTDFCKEYQSHITFERIDHNITLPDTYSIIDNANKILKSDITDISGTYNYLLSRKAYGVDESIYQIQVIPDDFSQKDVVIEIMDKWNDEHELETDKVLYTDVGKMIVNMVEKYVGILVLVLFIIIGVVIFSNLLVTSLLSILEINSRTREIGLYRSLGANSHFVRSLFVVEQGLIGLFCGVLGIALSYGLIPIINLILEKSITAAVISNFAVLQWWMALIVAVIAITIGVLSTLGPAIIATKKNPSKALREI